MMEDYLKEILFEMRKLRNHFDDLLDEVESMQKQAEKERAVPSAAWEMICTFYPNRSSRCEDEFDAFRVRYRFPEDDFGGVSHSEDGQYRLVYVSGNHERDSSGDHYVAYRRK